MKRERNFFFYRKRSTQAGMTMLETVVALGVLLVAATGVMGLAGVALSTTETQGHLAARTTEYAQDKMEQLLALKFCDGDVTGTAGTDTRVFPAVVGTGTGLAGCSNMTNGTAQGGGGLNTTAPTAGYVDYLDASGNLVASTGAWQYVRVWQITAMGTSMKQISVKTQARRAVGNSGRVPEATVVALKTYPF